MVGSFIILAIAFILHLLLISLEPTFPFLSAVTQYTEWAVIILGGIFLLFVILQIVRLIAKIFKNKGE